SENVRTKFTLSDSNRDGYIRSLETGVKDGGIDQSIVSGDIVWTPTDNIDIRDQASRMESQYTEPRVADAVWHGAAWYPAKAGLLYEHAGMPYSQESQMSGWPGGEVGKWENRSEITIPNRYIREQASLDVKWNINDKLSVDFLTGYTNVLSKTFI